MNYTPLDAEHIIYQPCEKKYHVCEVRAYLEYYILRLPIYINKRQACEIGADFEKKTCHGCEVCAYLE